MSSKNISSKSGIDENSLNLVNYYTYLYKYAYKYIYNKREYPFKNRIFLIIIVLDFLPVKWSNNEESVDKN